MSKTPTLTDRADEINRQVKGWIIPIYSEMTDNGCPRNLLSEDDFNKVAYGYACSECLAEFHTYMAVCPVCHHERDVQKDIENKPPQLWLDHLKSADAIERMEEKAVPVIPRGIDEFMKDVEADTDIEHIKL